MVFSAVGLVLPNPKGWDMAGKIPEHFIQEVLARTDLVELIDARVPLKRSGTNYTARCPFHNEKTPSFSVSQQKQFYYCFGCGARGTAISFLMEFERLSFPEAIEALAASLNLPVPRESAGERNLIDPAESLGPLYEVNEKAATLYQRQLKSHMAAASAVDYLKKRGVTGEVAFRYRLGFAPPGNLNLPSDWPKVLLKGAGLIGEKEPGRHHAWFRDRIMFPIRDRRGRIVGFGGRVIGDGQPKYLNSPETPIFHKHREVYGLFELLEAVRKPDYILVVEGYMDVIGLGQHGLLNAVATLGTATSTEQVGLLFRYTSHIVFCFDGDAAGQRAAWKALESSVAHVREGRQIRFLMLPEGHDPDSLIREEGLEVFRGRVDEAMPFSDYFFQHLSLGLDLRAIEGRAALAGKARPLLERMAPGIFRELLEERLREETGVGAAYQNDSSFTGVMRASRANKGLGQPSAFRTFFAPLVQHPEWVEHMDSGQVSTLGRIHAQGPLLMRVVEFLHEHPHIHAGGLLEGFRESAEGEIISKLIAWDTQVNSGALEEAFLDHLRHLTEKSHRESRLDALIEKSKHETLSDQEREELRSLTAID